MNDKKNDEKIIHLAEAKNRSLLNILVSRNFVFSVALLAQIFLYFAFFVWFSGFQTAYSVIQTLFTFAMLIYLFNAKINDSTKLTWFFIIGIMPLAGSVFLLYTRLEIGLKLFSSRVLEIQKIAKDVLSQSPASLETLQNDSPLTHNIWKYVNKSGCFPIHKNTDAIYYASTNDCFEDILKEIDKAEKFIFLEYFILEEGHMWTRLLKKLIKKAKEGVEIRLIYDGRCEINLLPHNYPEKLAELGIKAKIFAPITPILSTYYNYRDHRKIIVIDGKTAFTGGFNIADEYIGKTIKFGHWKDSGIMIKGSAADNFTLMFLEMWNIDEVKMDFHRFINHTAHTDNPMHTNHSITEQENTIQQIEYNETKPNTVTSTNSSEQNSYILPYADTPLDGDRVGKNVYINLLYRANRYCYIMTPYLILDGELESAILNAAKRGVNIKMVLPGIPDKKIPYAIAKNNYKTLVAAGVEIFEYTPGFSHSKMLVSDDNKAVVGSINLDYRSLYYNFECAVYLYNTPCIADIKKDFEDTIKKSQKITPRSIKREKIFYRLTGTLLKFIAPLL